MLLIEWSGGSVSERGVKSLLDLRSMEGEEEFAAVAVAVEP